MSVMSALKRSSALTKWRFSRAERVAAVMGSVERGEAMGDALGVINELKRGEKY